MCIPQAILFVETENDKGSKTCSAQIGNHTKGGELWLSYSFQTLGPKHNQI